jgi:V8-like Glu-specific endopeptidase
VARPDPEEGERRNGHVLGAAISHVVTPETVLVAGYVEESQDRGEQAQRLVEAGFSRELWQNTSLGVAAGAGLNDDSPRYRLRLALKYSFSSGR